VVARGDDDTVTSPALVAELGDESFDIFEDSELRTEERSAPKTPPTSRSFGRADL
jgi:hypothetical protein